MAPATAVAVWAVDGDDFRRPGGSGRCRLRDQAALAFRCAARLKAEGLVRQRVADPADAARGVLHADHALVDLDQRIVLGHADGLERIGRGAHQPSDTVDPRAQPVELHAVESLLAEPEALERAARALEVVCGFHQAADGLVRPRQLPHVPVGRADGTIGDGHIRCATACHDASPALGVFAGAGGLGPEPAHRDQDTAAREARR